MPHTISLLSIVFDTTKIWSGERELGGSWKILGTLLALLPLLLLLLLRDFFKVCIRRERQDATEDYLGPGGILGMGWWGMRHLFYTKEQDGMRWELQRNIRARVRCVLSGNAVERGTTVDRACVQHTGRSALCREALAPMLAGGLSWPLARHGSVQFLVRRAGAIEVSAQWQTARLPLAKLLASAATHVRGD